MSKIENSIGWCDETTNAVTGCDKVSPGCKNCYAQVGTRARVLRAQGIETWGAGGSRMPVDGFRSKIRRLNKLCVCDVCHQAHPISELNQRCNWYSSDIATDEIKCCDGINRRIRVFADSNSDWLDGKWSNETLADFLKAIYEAPNVDVLLLTKRPENFKSRMLAATQTESKFEGDGIVTAEGKPGWALATASWGGTIEGLVVEPFPNVWLGVSVENQAMADLRIPQVLEIPAAVRFLSCEPLLEVVRIPIGVDWVIVGGESGKDRRDCGLLAIEAVAAQCEVLGIPVYVKQDCGFKSGEQGRIPDAVWKLKQFPTAKDAKDATI